MLTKMMMAATTTAAGNTRSSMISISISIIQLLAFATDKTLAASLLPEGVTPVDLEPLPFEKVGTTAEVYESGIAAAVVGLRRKIHENPGTMYEEYEASEIAYQTLRAIGIQESNIKRDLGHQTVTGMIAHIGAGTLDTTMDGEIPTIVLRADMDALPIDELTDVQFKSKVKGVMHACGHDSHTAMLLGAAMVLKRHEEELVANGAAVRLFFQPAEEGGAGAKAMINAGALRGASAALMLHVAPHMATGFFSVTPGLSMASCHTFHVVVKGVSAHGAKPHQSRDSVAATGAIISGIHQIVSRTVDPTDSAVISIGYVHGGNAFNVIPDTMELGGTIRLLCSDCFESFFSVLTSRIQGIAKAYGCTAEVRNRDGETMQNSRGEDFTIRAFPVMKNNEDLAATGAAMANSMFGSGSCAVSDQVTMACEDFSFVAKELAADGAASGGTSFTIGTRHPSDPTGSGTGTAVHNPLFDIDERALPRGSAFLSTMALHFAAEAKGKK